MPTLHKFKLLATQCAVAGSPSRTSPTTSPVIHLRRRKTLRMLLLSRPSDNHHRRRFHPPPPPKDPPDDAARVRHKLKDLFVSSPPSPPPPPLKDDEHQQRRQHLEPDGLLPGTAVGVRFRTGSPCRGAGFGALRPVSSAFRYRLLRRIWRPVLVTIPE